MNFSVLVQYSGGSESLFYTKSVRSSPNNDGGFVLLLDDKTTIDIYRGDNVFVMNAEGQTVRRYKP